MEVTPAGTVKVPDVEMVVVVCAFAPIAIHTSTTRESNHFDIREVAALK
jgi:hypothetical protein